MSRIPTASLPLLATLACTGGAPRPDAADTFRRLHEPLSMGWCLECHRNPEPHLRPLDQVTNLGWEPPADGVDPSTLFYSHEEINPRESCSTCHR